MLTVTAQNFIREDKIEEYRQLIGELTAETLRETGCISYRVYRDTKDKEHFCIIENWESIESFKAHVKSEHFQSIVPRIEKYKKQEDIVNIYEEFQS